MISIGLDLSLTRTGIAILEDGELLYSGVVTSKPVGDTPLAETKRLVGIRDSIVYALDMAREKWWEDCVVAIEGLAFMARNSTALVQLAGLNYLLRTHLMEGDIRFVIVTPTTLKKFITGKGNCEKNLVLLEVYKQWGESFDDDNVADAFGLAKIAYSLDDDVMVGLTRPRMEVISLIKNQTWQTTKTAATRN